MSAINSELSVIDNPEKTTHSGPREDGILPAFPVRHLITGRPGSGKGVQCANLIAREDPPFDRYVLCHWEKEPEEWMNLLDDQPEFEVYAWREDGLPEIDVFDRKKKNCLIIDEIPFDHLTIQQRNHLERIFNFACSHKSITAFILAQDIFSVPISVRRAMDFISIVQSPIRSTEGLLSRMLKMDIGSLMRRFCKTQYDCLVFDFTGQGPPVRLNWFTPIDGVVVR